MRDRNKNRLGYKRTKVGWIPESWSVYNFDDLFQRLRQPVNVDPQKKYQEIGIRSHGKGIFHKDQVRGVDLGDKSVFWVRTPALIFNIVFAWEQAVGVTSGRERGMIASHRFPMYGAKRSDVVIDYVYQFFLTKKGKHLLGLASPGGAGRNKTLGQSELHRLLLPLPSFQEQKKITEILYTWQKAIDCTRELIDAKRHRKKALMQQLLSRKKRFPGFKRTWELHMLGDLAFVIFSNVDKKTTPDEISVRLCNYTDVYYNDRITKDMSLMKATATNAEIERCKVSLLPQSGRHQEAPPRGAENLFPVLH